MEANRLLILHDWKGFLSGKFEGVPPKHFKTCIDIKCIKEKFEAKNYIVDVKNFSSLDFGVKYSGWYVLYASSEERGQFYKDFIEDVLLRLEIDGAILIPSFYFFRAHHNKLFAELYRTSFNNDELKYLKSKAIGRLEELDKLEDIKFPCVVKTSSGSGSSGVRLAREKKELYLLVKELSCHTYKNYYYTWFKDFGNGKLMWTLKALAKMLLRRNFRPNKRPHTRLYSNKIIIQEYIKNLDGDYKVLYYGGNYYVLNRKNRKGDFRASGSGKFVFPNNIEDIKDILDFAKLIVEEFKMPMISMDIAQDQKRCYLIEYQCVCFGSYTIQFSECYFVYDYMSNKWEKKIGASNLEHEYFRSIDEYIQSQNLLAKCSQKCESYE